ncbi:MAG TPA: sialidase family protein [Actinomycetota bacterium]
MRRRLLLTVAAMTLVTLVAAPVRAPAQEGESIPEDIEELKEEIKTPVIAGDLGGSGSFGASAQAADLAQALQVGTNVQVSQDQDPAEVLRSGASELSVAARGDMVVAGWNDGEGFAFAPFDPDQPPLGLSGYGFSNDNGDTWTDGGAPPIGSTVAFGPGTEGRSETGEYVTRGDPWLDVPRNGPATFYYANLAVWTDDADLPPAGVSLHTGQFDDSTFTWNDSVLLQSPNYPNDFLDKEALAVDRRKGQTSIYVTLTNFEEVCDQPFFGFGTIELYGSTDGGSTWNRTIIQPDESFITDPADPDCGADGIVNQGSMPAVGPNGELYVVWERGWFAPAAGGAELDRATVAFASSTDQGATFSAPSEVTSLCSQAANAPAAYNRTSSNDFPRIAVSQSGPDKGRIYVTYHDCSAAEGDDAPFGADTDVYVTYSDDGGATWSEPTAVSPTADGVAQFWPAVSTGAGGRVDVTYYHMEDVNLTEDPDDIECSVRTGGPLDDPDLKESTLTTLSDVYWVRSSDGGATWGEPQRVTDTTTNWCAATPINSIIPNFGDYNTHVTQGPTVFATWADGRNAGIVDRVPTAWFARAK